MHDSDILAKLNRLLAVTPESSLTVPPIERRTLTATVVEIRTLRERLAALESDQAGRGATGQSQ